MAFVLCTYINCYFYIQGRVALSRMKSICAISLHFYARLYNSTRILLTCKLQRSLVLVSGLKLQQCIVCDAMVDTSEVLLLLQCSSVIKKSKIAETSFITNDLKVSYLSNKLFTNNQRSIFHLKKIVFTLHPYSKAKHINIGCIFYFLNYIVEYNYQNYGCLGAMTKRQ